MTEFYLPTWLFEAIIISIWTSLLLNGLPFLPGLQNIKPRRIEARWVGYLGLSAALGLWISLHPKELAVHTGIAWGIICLGTLVPNTLVHLYRRDAEKSEAVALAFLTERQQVLLENAIGAYLGARRDMELLETMLKALCDPRYAGNPDRDSIRWRQEVEANDK